MFGLPAKDLFASFHDLTVAGFSENQALKLMALMVSSCDTFDGMPAAREATMALHPSKPSIEEMDLGEIPDFPPGDLGSPN